MSELLQRLLKVYPEFKPVAVTPEQLEFWNSCFEKAKCVYPKFRNITDDNLGCCNILNAYFMLTAHYFVVNGYANEIGINANSGSVASSSVGDVSISLNTPPYGQSGKPNFDYWLSKTPYGQEFLFWVSLQSGMLYVNN